MSDTCDVDMISYFGPCRNCHHPSAFDRRRQQYKNERLALGRVPTSLVGPILWGHSGPLCHALSLSLWTSILHCYSWLRLILVVVSTVATPGEWQCKIRTGGVRRLAVASGPNIFQTLLVVDAALSQVAGQQQQQQPTLAIIYPSLSVTYVDYWPDGVPLSLLCATGPQWSTLSFRWFKDDVALVSSNRLRYTVVYPSAMTLHPGLQKT